MILHVMEDIDDELGFVHVLPTEFFLQQHDNFEIVKAWFGIFTLGVNNEDNSTCCYAACFHLI